MNGKLDGEYQINRFERDSVSNIRKLPAFFLVFGILASGVSAAQSAGFDIPGTVAAVNAMAANDLERVRSGNAPPEILNYDRQIQAMLVKAPALQAKQDKAGMRAWAKKVDALVAARGNIRDSMKSGLSGTMA